MVDDGRIREDEELVAPGRAASLDQLERLLGQPLGELARVGDGRRRAEKDRVRTVVPADSPQPPQHVAQMAAEDASIRVELVNHHVAQVLEQLGPARVVREDARVQHVGVAQHQMRARPNRPPGVLRRVTVVGEDADLLSSSLRQGLAQALKLRELILRERLGRKQIERTAGGILQDGVQHRRVVAERLARRRRRDHDDVAAGQRVLDRFGLMRVEL